MSVHLSPCFRGRPCGLVVHGLGKRDPLVEELPGWQALAKDETVRQAHWQQWLHVAQTERELGALRQSVTSGRPYGTKTWVGIHPTP